MNKLIGKIEINIYNDYSAFISFSPQNDNILIIMFAYYLDRILHNLSRGVAYGFIDLIGKQNNKFIDSNQNEEAEIRLKNASFGTENRILTKKSDKKKVFGVKGEYYNNKNESYLQTKFKPIFVNNDFIEKYSLDSVSFLHDYILNYCSVPSGTYFMIIINNMLRKYMENHDLPPLGETPSICISNVTETFEKNDLFNKLM